jgi:hypothetical protein
MEISEDFMKRIICFSLLSLLCLSGCNSDNNPIQREEEVDRSDTSEDSYDQNDIHSGNDVLPDDIDTGVSEQ